MPGGDQVASFTGAQIACFAVRTCTLSSGADLVNCSTYGRWGLRPASGGGRGLLVVVVVKFPAVTSALSSLVAGCTLYLRQSSLGNELYF